MASDYVPFATTSDGPHARSAPGEPVAVPLDGLRGRRGLVAGAPDAGIEDATAALARHLLEADQSLLVVDADGSCRDLARDHDVRLVGDDAEMDGRVTPANADRIAAAAAEEGVVLDRNSFDPDLDPGESVRAIAEALGRDRRGRMSLLVVLVDCHEWLPDAGDSPCADALRALGSETVPGVGVVGTTDRPGAVDAQFRRDCDWIAAHRVSWREHVDAVSRILGRGHEDALESLDDSEAFLHGPWLDEVERVRFDGREPAGASTGRRDATGSTGSVARGRSDGARPPDADGDVAELSAEVADLRGRIEELETAIEDGADVAAVAEELADAIADRLDSQTTAAADRGSHDTAEAGTSDGGREETTGRSRSAASGSDRPSTRREDDEPPDAKRGFGAVFDAFADAGGDSSTAGTTAASDGATAPRHQSGGQQTTTNASNGADDGGASMAFEPTDFASHEGATGGAASPDDVPSRRSGGSAGERRVPRYVRDLVRTVEEMDATTRKMLAHYVDRGADTPLNAHFSAGGAGDRTAAYAHNRQLRTTNFVEHVGRGHYAPTIPAKVRTEADRELSADDVSKAAEHVRRALR